MSGESSSVAGWFSRLESIRRPENIYQRADDLRLSDLIETWKGDPAALRPGRAVLIGFPQDEGVKRNHGRPGAAEAPNEIRRWLYRLTSGGRPSDPDLSSSPPLDVGNVRIAGSLEESQQALAEVVAGVLKSKAVPIVLGGGHETAYGVFLGYVAAGVQVGIINIDAHLDVRPTMDGKGHSGSPFRQALEHPSAPLGRERYVCLGAQPYVTSREQVRWAQERGCVIHWDDELDPSLAHHFVEEHDRLAEEGCSVHLSVDADAVCIADVPGVSAPNPVGLSGVEVVDTAWRAGNSREVTSLDLVEINPRHDRDAQSARWAAILVWSFMMGLLSRPG